MAEDSKKFIPEELFCLEDSKGLTYCFIIHEIYQKLFITKEIVSEETLKKNYVNPLSGDVFKRKELKKIRSKYIEWLLDFKIKYDCIYEDTNPEYFELSCDLYPKGELTSEYFKDSNGRDEVSSSKDDKIASIKFVYDSSVIGSLNLSEKTILLSWIGVYSSKLRGLGKFLICKNLLKLKEIGMETIVLYPVENPKQQGKLKKYYETLGFEQQGDIMIAKISDVCKKCKKVSFPC